MNFDRLILAIFHSYCNWMLSEGQRPHIQVRSNSPDVKLPPYLQQQPLTTINLDAEATTHMVVNEYGVSFSARFSGRSYDCYIPLRDIVGFVIYVEAAPGQRATIVFPMLPYPQSTDEIGKLALDASRSKPPKPVEVEEVAPVPSAQEETTPASSEVTNVVQLFPRKK